MRKVFKIFLFLMLNIIYLNSITYTKNNIIENKVKKMAYEKITNHAANFIGEFNEFLDQGIDYIDVHITELNGENDEEAAVLAGYHYGEGGIEHYLMIYENIYNNPVLTHFINTHGTTIHNNYYEITDLDNNGISEILIIGDGNSGYDKSPIFLYKLEKNSLKDMIWGNDSGCAYYHVDIDYDNIEEIISISKNNDFEIEIEILKNENGFYKKTAPSDDFKEQLKDYFENIIITQNYNLIKQHDYEDLQLLAEAVNSLNLRPSNMLIFQENLENIYNKAHYFDKTNILDSMLWDENGKTKMFLQKILTEELNKNQRDINCFLIKSIIKSQFRFNDETGIDLLFKYYNNDSNNYNKRKKIIYYTIGDLIEYNNKCYDFLINIYTESNYPEIKRLINIKLSSCDKKQIDINELEKSVQLFYNTTDENKIKIIQKLSNNKNKKAVSILIKAYENPVNNKIKNEIINALSNQIKNYPEIYKKKKIKNIINEFINQCSLKDINKILKNIGNILDEQTVINIIKTDNNKNFNDETLKNALQALSISKSDEVKQIMKDYINHKNKYIQIICIEYFSKIKDYDIENCLIKIFNTHPDKYVRCLAAEALGNLGTENAEEILLSNFNNYINHYGYNEYIQGMLSLDSEKVKQYFIDEFKKLNKEKNYNYLFYIYLDTLIKIDPDSIYDNLTEWINPEYPDRLRLRAIYQLAKSNNPGTKKMIKIQLNTADRSLRKKIINSLNNENDNYNLFIY